MSSRLAKPGQTDQKKVYLNWANHYLRKAGGDQPPLSDLKEIANGQSLPRVLKAVVQEPVPGIRASVNSDDERRENIDKCIEFLNKFGVNCSSFTAKDLCDGKDRAVLALFYSLSQYKRAPGNTPSKGSTLPSRIGRPVSPSLKATHGVIQNGGLTSNSKLVGSPQPTQKESSPKAQPQPEPQEQAPQKERSPQKELSLSVTPSSPPATSPLSPNVPHKGLGGPRRTAGSSITSATFSPYVHRGKGAGPSKPPGEGGSKSETEVKQSGGESGLSESFSGSSEVKSDPETEGDAASNLSKPGRGSKLTKHSSFSFGSHHHHKDSRLLKPTGSGKAEEGAESASPTSKPRSLSGGSSKLQAPSHKNKDLPSSASSGDAPEETATNEEKSQNSSSRLKFHASGRTTPSNNTRSGIQRPSSRLSKKASSSTSNLLEGEEQGEGQGGGAKGEKALRLQRKSSDGAVKRHLVNPNALKASLGSHGSASSLPRHLPKGLLSAQASEDPASEKEGMTSGKEGVASNSNHIQEPTAAAKDKATKGQGSSEGCVASGLRKPGGGGLGLKKPGTGLMSGVRTPNLPSSGPQTSNTSEGERSETSHASPSSTHEPPVAGQTGSSSQIGGSPSLGGKKLMQLKASGLGKPQSLEGRLKRPTSPSTKHRLHRISPAPQGRQSPKPASDQTPSPSTPRQQGGKAAGDHPPLKALYGGVASFKKEAELSSSGSSVETEGVSEVKSPRPAQVSSEATPTTTTPTTDLAKSAEKVADVSPGVKEEAGSQDSHLRFGRRISPEGMSHEEITSPKVEATPTSASESLKDATNRKQEVTSLEGGQEASPSHQSRGMSGSPKTQRARSLSPKSPYRLVPKGMIRVKDLDGGGAGALMRAHSSDSTSSEGATPTSLGKKPLKSSLRQKRGGSKSRHSSSSSMEGVVSSPGLRQPKVTISPRSSQVVYDPEETGLHPPPSGPAYKFLTPGGPTERPSSFASSMDSSTTSESLSPSNSTTALYPRPGSQGAGARRSSLRSELLEQPGLPTGPGDMVSSTPELIESFENQLTSMKAELSDKDRMLSMYETSMADLSTKMHMLKKSLEEKDNAIRHLTEKQTWYDLEGHSLMTSRAQSVMGGDPEALSDGYLSDSMLEEGKEKNKKKKAWKNPFKSSKKKEGSSHAEQISPNADTESVISARTAKSLKRSFGKKKAPDLMSISEYPPEGRFKDLDTKSTLTMDLRSEYGGGPVPLWEDDPVKVYDDPEPGTRAEVMLYIDTNETTTKSPANDSGYYGDLLSSRYGNSGNNKWRPDSIASNTSSDSGNHGDDANEQFILGMLSIPPELSWVGMDGKVADIFHHHLNNIDPEGSLGLNEDSIYCYVVGEERRQVGNALLPPVTPYQALGNKLTIKVHMKGAGQQACDSLAYKTLMGTESLQSYMQILHETQWLVVMGTKGTCKSSLVSGLAQHLSSCLEAEEGEGMEDLVMGVVGGEIVKFNLDKEGVAAPLKYFKTDLVKRVQLQLQPPIVVLEDVYECKDLEQLLVAASALSRRPYIVAALSSGTTKGIPLHQLLFHHQIRVITCNPQTDPVVGILARSLRKQVYQLKATAQSLEPVAERLVNWIPYLLNHLNFFINKFHSNVVNLGPRVFMSCPLNNNSQELENWFLSLWNHFIIPYLMGTIMAGIETYTADPLLEWVDVREWVVETYPWPSAINVSKLRTLNPEDVGWNHAVRPHQNRYIMLKDDKIADDARSILHHDTQSMIH